MKASIKGIGWVTAAGCGMGRNAQAQPLRQGTLEIPTRKQIFPGPDKRFGRLDPFSRVGLAGITFCLRDAGEEQWLEKRPIGIVAASRYGCLATDIAYLETMLPDGGKLASPNLFAYTLPNCFLGEAALRFGLTGNSLILNQKDESKLSAVRFALEELVFSDQQGVLAGITDLEYPITPDANDLPGSLFMLLGRETGAENKPYGELELVGEQLFFNGKEVSDLPELITACLATNK
jgi:3-oxoacyl-[acyl-carrier-protein] synthase II